ncbi:hypothetical protein C8Q80DRAFT_388595 [Daedaleopsis nitida]|nr:hypothetical protein C8Q80DRAFT_388595 [Daedaleopsis nitida]
MLIRHHRPTPTLPAVPLPRAAIEFLVSRDSVYSMLQAFSRSLETTAPQTLQTPRRRLGLRLRLLNLLACHAADDPSSAPPRLIPNLRRTVYPTAPLGPNAHRELHSLLPEVSSNAIQSGKFVPQPRPHAIVQEDRRSTSESTFRPSCSGAPQVPPMASASSRHIAARPFAASLESSPSSSPRPRSAISVSLPVPMPLPPELPARTLGRSDADVPPRTPTSLFAISVSASRPRPGPPHGATRAEAIITSPRGPVRRQRVASIPEQRSRMQEPQTRTPRRTERRPFRVVSDRQICA